MAIVNGCEFPEGLLYFVERTQMTWVRIEGEEARVGLTDPAQTRAGKILHLRIKTAGTERERGRPVATVESGKWAGPVMAPLTGVVVEPNAEVEQDPGLLNTDPYGKGWIVRLRFSKPEELRELLDGPAALARFKEILERDNIRCMRCQQ
ncbi:glycine cleavage system protein H [mine drainage metagenome]|uniref:Glycine cleavage system protein H n=1 Tax=mine drainage metagenome TaxID=410659 RepID=T0Z807_9ZZZZ